MSFFKNKKVLVTGGTGLIGRPLVNRLINEGAKVTVVSLDEPIDLNKNVKFIKTDLRELSSCIKCCENQEIIFHLAGVKGSPAMTATKPASFLVPTIQFSFNMMEAARRVGVEKFLFTSSVGVYAPAEIFHEDDVWKTFPSENDKFAGWAKRLCELQAESYKIEYGLKNISIVRPANVYGPFDNFDPDNAMVIPSLINRALTSKNKLSVWGDGSPIRDFIFSEDVADGMLTIVEKGITEPVNLGSGKGITIKEIAENIAKHVPNGPLEVEWDVSKPKGDAKRIMSTKLAEKHGFKAKTSINEGILKTINWFNNNNKTMGEKYNSFTEN